MTNSTWPIQYTDQ